MQTPPNPRRHPNTYIQIPEDILHIHRVLQEHGKRCYMVGGSIRNAVMGLEPEDFDLATDALPEEVMGYFPRVVPTGIKYGTVLIVIEGRAYEITTLRGEGNYMDGRRPEVVNFTTDIHGDLSRRDFTMNALALDCASNEIIDDFGGVEDIHARVLRAVGDPLERFREDGLRVMRAFRFMRYGRPDAALEEAIDGCREMLGRISQERITAELMKILEAPSSREIVESMMVHRIFDIIAPEISSMKNVHDPVHGETVWYHTMVVMGRLDEIAGMRDDKEACAELRLAALLHDIGKTGEPARDGIGSDPSNPPDALGPFDPFPGHEKRGAELVGRMLLRLKCPNKTVASMVFMVRNHMEPLRLRKASLGELRMFKFRAGRHLEDLLELSMADHAGLPGGAEEEEAFQRQVKGASVEKDAKPLVSGNDIMEETGFLQGRKIGTIKKKLFSIQIEKDIRDRETMLEILRDLKH